MEIAIVCRLCLKGVDLHPIFANSSEWARYSRALFTTTGVEVTPNDGLPQQICIFCVNFVNQSLEFRKSCIDIQSKLQDLKNNLQGKTYFNDDDIKKLVTNISVSNKAYKSICTEIKVEEEPIETKNHNSDESGECEEEYTDVEILEDEDDDASPENINDSLNTSVKSDKVDEANLPNPEILPYYPSENSKARRKRVICKICKKDFSIRSIDAHISRAHPGADIRKLKCELCDKFIVKKIMERHMKLKHGVKNGQEKIFVQCGYCKFEFDRKEDLIEHVVNCTAKKKKSKVWAPGRELVECDVCGKQMQKASLKFHKAMRHAGMKPVCKHCGKAFGNKLRLDEHYRAKHGYEKFKCSYCDFESSSLTAMKNHERRHRGEKPYVCETCGAQFHASYLLVQHKQSHRLDRPVKCDECSASFKAANSLHMHRKTCHGAAIYKCCLCSRSFTSRHYTVKHMRRAHRYTDPIPDSDIKAHVTVSADEILGT